MDMAPEAICQIRCGMVLRTRRESRAVFPLLATPEPVGSSDPTCFSFPYLHPAYASYAMQAATCSAETPNHPLPVVSLL